MNRLQILNEWLHEFGFDVRPLNIHSGDHDQMDEWFVQVMTDLHDVLQGASRVCLMGFSAGATLVHHFHELLFQHQIDVAGVVLLEPTSGRPDEVYDTLSVQAASSNYSFAKPMHIGPPSELQISPYAILILALQAMDDPVAAAQRYGLAGLQEHLLTLYPNMKTRVAGAVRSARWDGMLQAGALVAPREFECPVFLVSCAEVHPLFRGVAEPELNESVWAPRCRLPPTTYMLKGGYDHINLPYAEILGLPVVQFLCSISSTACNTQRLESARARSRRRQAEILAVCDLYRQRWREFDESQGTTSEQPGP